jgi:hypothetical protein
MEEWTEEEGSISVPTTTRAEHWNAICDECGVAPIVGTRYKSTRHPNYDICEDCLKDNHDGFADCFVPLTRVTNLNEARLFEPPGKRSISLYGIGGVASILNNDPTVVDVTLHMTQGTLQSECDAIAESFAQNTSLRSCHFTLAYNRKYDNINALEALVKGIIASSSIEIVSWTINGGADMSDAAVQVFCDLIEHSKSVRYMSIKLSRRFIPPPRRDGGQGLVQLLGLEDDSVATRFLSALANSSLDTFRFEKMDPFGEKCPGLSDESKILAWEAMKTNPNLKRIKADFKNKDYMLDLLIADKKNRWMERWAGDHVTNLGRLAVIDEICESDLDEVPAFYHYIRSQPMLLLR